MSVSDDSKESYILAVDDSPDNLFLIETILDTPEYNLALARSGREALSTVAQKVPDLILLDIMMPGMDGFEVTRRIRQDESLNYIPILLITAHDQVSLVEGLDAGADDFIRKPFDIEELQARVRSLIRMKQAMDSQALMIRQRDDFVARLTHDLRTPLVAANRMLEFCKDEAFGVVAEEAKEAIAETIHNNDQLLSMVNTLLEVYRHEAGYKTLAFTSVNLYQIVNSVVDILKPLADEKRLSLKLTGADSRPIEHPEPFQMQGDAMELRRVVTNLIGNAIKFTDEGYVHVQLQRISQVPLQVTQSSPTLSADQWLMLEVKDTGIGISPEDQAEIFAWFRQGRQRRSGSGLGLHLGYRIVKMHGGLLSVESAVGQGSTFTLYLPVIDPV